MADPIFGSGIAVDPEDVSDHFGHFALGLGGLDDHFGYCALGLGGLRHRALGLGGLDGPRQPGLGNNTGGDVCFQRMNQT